MLVRSFIVTSSSSPPPPTPLSVTLMAKERTKEPRQQHQKMKKSNEEGKGAAAASPSLENMKSKEIGSQILRTHRMCRRLLSTSSNPDDKAFQTWHCRQIAYISVGRGIFASPSLSHMIQGRLEMGEGERERHREMEKDHEKYESPS